MKVSAPVNVSSVDIGASRPLYLWTEFSVVSPENESTTSILTVENWALKHYLHNEDFEKGMLLLNYFILIHQSLDKYSSSFPIFELSYLARI